MTCMVNRKEIWQAAQAASGAIGQNVNPAVQEGVQNSPFKDIPKWFFIGTAFYIRPEPLTVRRLRVRNPYGNPQAQAKAIQSLQEANLLDSKGIITQEAVAAYQALIDIQNAVADELDKMDTAKLQQVLKYINHAYEAALKVEEPATLSLQDATRLDMHNGLVHQIFYKIGRLGAFRDDCHIAAWKPLEIDGNLYEAFSLVWDGTADSAAKLFEARSNRGYEEADWQSSLDKLVEMGWLEKDDDAYKTTDEGQKIRDEIEVKTDEYFYQAFAGLSDKEMSDFLTLLQEVQENFTAQPEPQA